MSIFSKLFGIPNSDSTTIVRNNGITICIIEGWGEVDKLEYNKEFRLIDDEDNVIRIKQASPEDINILRLEAINVTGLHIGNRHSNLVKIIFGSYRRIKLVREPENPKDKNAIMAIGQCKYKGKYFEGHIGYIPKEYAEDLKDLGELAATIKTMYMPNEDKSAGIRINIWRGPNKYEEAYETEKADPLKAIELYKSFIKDNYQCYISYSRLAIIYRKQKLYDEEVNAIEEAIERFKLLLETDTGKRDEYNHIIDEFNVRLKKAILLRDNKHKKENKQVESCQ